MKRSTQVALLLMGAAGVGASAYALAPGRRDCVPSGTTPPAAASRLTDKDPKLEQCPPRRSYGYSNTGYYRSYWYSSGPSHWSTPIFARRSAQTSATSTNSPTSLGFTGPGRPSTSTTTRPSTSTTTSRPSTTGPGFGTIGRSIASHSTSS